jgi:hypothetical protein
MGWPNRMRATLLLLSPPSILSKTNSNLWILLDFIFQINLDFMSNSNLNPLILLPHPYISLGAPPPCLPTPILPQNKTLATTQVSPHRRCSSPPPTLFQIPPFNLNHVSVVRIQGPNHRRKNHVESQSIALAIYHRTLAVVSHQGCDFFDELEVNPTSPVSSPCRTLALGLYWSEIGAL